MTGKENVENKSLLSPHPLEGKYIICSYTEQDQEPEDGWVPETGTALALYKLKKESWKKSIIRVITLCS